ncbi:hypothetical protein CPB84DRAFT_443093 [Gymnopilus junonius]|uniref:DUF6533 domain-containing protein n=1 Tax=Gymnopilus junonius TaxID=109634 RepID=A0A9P5TH41_GYMJU|nr:hypothetical protein CPB84DRAFT_443093 [Gymnopilus junonius]
MADLTQASVDWLYADQALSILFLATATCVIYDHITTLDEEVELIWKRPKWTRVQFFFFINRYVGDAMQLYGAFVFVRHILGHTNDVSNYSTILLANLGGIVMGAMQCIMIYRISSMYENKERAILLLYIGLVFEWLAVVLIHSLCFVFKDPAPDPAPDVVPCAQISFPPWLYTMWIPIAGFDFLLMSLTLSPAVKHYRSMKSMKMAGLLSGSTIRHGAESSLAYILLRDSITFPFIALLVSLGNLVVFMQEPVLAAQLSLSIALFIPCVVGSRLILNLRETYYQPFLHECKEPPDTGLGSDDSSADNMNMDIIIISGSHAEEN